MASVAFGFVPRRRRHEEPRADRTSPELVRHVEDWPTPAQLQGRRGTLLGLTRGTGRPEVALERIERVEAQLIAASS